jgi:hypothetical protein
MVAKCTVLCDVKAVQLPPFSSSTSMVEGRQTQTDRDFRDFNVEQLKNSATLARTSPNF